MMDNDGTGSFAKYRDEQHKLLFFKKTSSGVVEEEDEETNKKKKWQYNVVGKIVTEFGSAQVYGIYYFCCCVVSCFVFLSCCCFEFYISCNGYGNFLFLPSVFLSPSSPRISHQHYDLSLQSIHLSSLACCY